MSDLIINEVEQNFAMSFIGEDFLNVHLEDYRKELIEQYRHLCKKMENAYESYYPESPETLLKETSKIGGMLGGVKRRMRTAYIIAIFEITKEINNDCFKHFSVSCYQELSKYLFEISPSRSALLELFIDKKDAGRITHNGTHIADAIAVLCNADKKRCEFTTEVFNAVMDKFSAELLSIKNKSNEKILEIKKNQK